MLWGPTTIELSSTANEISQLSEELTNELRNTTDILAAQGVGCARWRFCALSFLHAILQLGTEFQTKIIESTKT